MRGDADIGRDAAPRAPARWGTGRRPGGPCRVERVSAPRREVWIDHLRVASHLRATDDRTSLLNSSNTAALSVGPGVASRWSWQLRLGRLSSLGPATDPALG